MPRREGTVNPEVLILDEPTNSLDEKSCRTLYDLLNERIKGTIIITHNLELSSIGSVIYCIQKGGIVLEKNGEKTNL